MSEATASPGSSASSVTDPVKRAQDQASRERAEAAASGDPITRPPRDGKAAGRENFGKAVLTDGDVTVYTPVPSRDGVVVPVKITNSGAERAFYKVAIRVTGPDGFDATVKVDTHTVGVYPGTDWPTELTATDPGKPVPGRPKLTVIRNEREAFGA